MAEAPAESDRRDTQVLRLVGLTRRAGRAVLGTKAVREAARRGSLSLALVARDAGENARNRVVPIFDATGTPWLSCGSCLDLGRSVGRERAVVVGIADDRFAAGMREILERGEGPGVRAEGRQESQ